MNKIAKEMFEEIKKELNANFIDVVPTKGFGYNISIKIGFVDSKKFINYCNGMIDIEEDYSFDIDILIKLLYAIQKQVEELGWNNE